MHIFVIKPDYKKLDSCALEILDIVEKMEPGYAPYHMPILTSVYLHYGQALADQGRFTECKKIIAESDIVETKAQGILSHAICGYVTGRFHSLLVMGELESMQKTFKHFIDVYRNIMQGYPSITVYPCMAMYDALQENDFTQPNHIDTAFEIFSHIENINALLMNQIIWLCDAGLVVTQKGDDKYLNRTKILLQKLRDFCMTGQAIGVKARYLKLQARYDFLTETNVEQQKIKNYLDEALTITESIGMHAETAFIHAEYALYAKFYGLEKTIAEKHYRLAMKIFKETKYWKDWLEQAYTENRNHKI